MIGASRLDCLLETGMWMHNIWSFQRYECSVQAMLLLSLLPRALWSVSRTVSSGHMVPSATHPCSTPLRRLPLNSHPTFISPSRFGVQAVAAQCPPEMALRVCAGEHEPPRATICLQGPLPHPAGKSEPPASASEPTCMPLWTPTPSHLFPKRWCGDTCLRLLVRLGMLRRTWSCWQGGTVPVKGPAPGDSSCQPLM